MSFAKPDKELKEAHQQATMIQLVGMHFSNEGREVCDVWKRVRRTYEKLDLQNEWQIQISFLNVSF